MITESFDINSEAIITPSSFFGEKNNICDIAIATFSHEIYLSALALFENEDELKLARIYLTEINKRTSEAKQNAIDSLREQGYITTSTSETEPDETEPSAPAPGTTEPDETEPSDVNNQPEVSNEAKKKADSYWSTLKQAIAPLAQKAGYVLEEDGNYYLTKNGNKYLCLYNLWTNDFDEYFVEKVQNNSDLTTETEPTIKVDEEGNITTTSNTLESVYLKSLKTAEKEAMIPTQDMGVYERDGERFVWSITHDRFIKETEATPEVKTWFRAFLEAMALAEEMGFMPVLTAFCIYEDANGKQYKYDIDEEKFVEHYV